MFAECIYRINPARGSVSRSRSSGGSGRFQSWFLVGFIFLLFLMGTINLACNTKMNQLMFIDNRDFPGGPNAWFFTNYNSGINTAGNAAYIIANFLADGLLVRQSRCLAAPFRRTHSGLLYSSGERTWCGTRSGLSRSLSLSTSPPLVSRFSLDLKSTQSR